jgi:hypothetical protein
LHSERFNLYFDYAKTASYDLFKLLKDLSESYVDVEKEYTTLNKCNRELKKIKDDFVFDSNELIPELLNNTKRLVEKYNEVEDKEHELTNDAFRNFIVKLSQVEVAYTLVWWGIVAIFPEEIDYNQFTSFIRWWLAIGGIVFYIFFQVYRRIYKPPDYGENE